MFEEILTPTDISEPKRGGKPKEGPILPHEEIGEKLQNLEKEMKEHEGELVLMVVRHWEPHGWDMPLERTPYGLDEDYYLGIIALPYLQTEEVFKRGFLAIGTKEYMEFQRDLFYEARPNFGIKKGEGLLEPRSAYYWNLNRESGEGKDFFHYFGPSKKLVEIVASNQNVINWMSEELTRHFDTNLYLAFRKMFQGLGRKLDLSEKVAKTGETKLQREKVGIVNSLNELLVKEGELSERIRRIYEFAEKGGGVIPVGEAITLVESEADALFFTWSQREQLEEIRGSLKSTLGKALDLEMHKGEFILKKEIGPGQEEVLDVPNFIRGLCQKYEVAIPENDK